MLTVSYRPSNMLLAVQPNELSKRLALFYSASLMAGAFGGLLAGVITQYMDGVGNTPGWQWVSRRHPDTWPELWRCAGL
jgi:MFS family permease